MKNRLNFSKTNSLLLKVFCLLILFFGIFSYTRADDKSCDINIDGKTNQELEIVLKKCEEEIQYHKNLLNNKQKDSVTIERDISIFQNKLEQSKLAIQKRGINIQKISGEIGQKVNEIGTLSSKIKEVRIGIAGTVRRINELDSADFLAAMFSANSVSDFFVDLDNLSTLGKNLKSSLSEVKEIKTKTEEVKISLEEKKEKERALKLVEETEKNKTEEYKKNKEVLLKMNRKQEDEYKRSIAEKERIKNEIKNRIFKTVGGTELRFEDALKLILPYREVIGVEPALVLAVLTQESAVDGVIGRNLGRCTYNQTAKNKSGTVMSDYQKKSFLAIIGGLGLDPEKTPVSCPIYSDGAYGGAMGPAQFMPSTWWDVDSGFGYKNRIARVLGVDTPSPFRNLDAFVGTALYLSDARSKCAGSFTSQFEIWSCSAAKYYSGLQSSGSRLANHMNPKSSYGYKVAARAQQFQKDIDLLDL